MRANNLRGQACRKFCTGFPAAAGYVFGFTERLRIGNHRIQLDVGSGAVVLAKGANPTEGESSTHSIMVRVINIEEHFAAAKETGADVSDSPVSYPYGEKQYVAVDLGGHHWTFSQSEANVEPSIWGGQLVQISGAA